MRGRWIPAIAGVWLLAACSPPRDEPEERTPILHPIPVRIDVIRADSWPDTWEAPGLLQRGQPVTLTSRMAGVVKRVAVSKGQRVKAGDLLVAFETGDIAARLKERDAAAEAVRDAAAVTAPADGRVTELFAVTGRILGKDAPLLRFETSDSYFETSVETLKLGGAEAGAAVKISVGDCEGGARILEITDSPLAGQKDIRTSLPACKGPMVETRGRIRFEGPAHQMVTVAMEAVVTKNDRTSVFLVEDGAAKLRRITVGEKRGDRMEAIAGLAPGAKVVLEPAADLKDNSPVTVAQRE